MSSLDKAGELLDKFERFYLYRSAPIWLKDNAYWNAFMKIRALRGIGCNYSKDVCKELISIQPELAERILREEVKK